MSGILYVVATPIGNLEDVTLRALRVLREVSLIAAEDTRRTARLLQHYSISTPTTSLHEHNEHAKSGSLIQKLSAGASIALVSDAGTPLISDPGSRLVAAAHAAGVVVLPIPGPSAVVAAISAAGMPSDGFTFAGFPPSRAKARSEWFRAFATHPYTLVIYEAPHRIRQTLTAIREELGERAVVLGRELTKSHEQLVKRHISAWINDPPPEKGEFTLVIFAPEHQKKAAPKPSDEDLLVEFGQITELQGLKRREGLKQMAVKHGMSAREVFAALERGKRSVE